MSIVHTCYESRGESNLDILRTFNSFVTYIDNCQSLMFMCMYEITLDIYIWFYTYQSTQCMFVTRSKLLPTSLLGDHGGLSFSESWWVSHLKQVIESLLPPSTSSREVSDCLCGGWFMLKLVLCTYQKREEFIHYGPL